METIQQPTLEVIGKRSATVLNHPQSMDDLYVQCRREGSLDFYVPARDLFALFEQELVAKMRASGNMQI